MADLTYIELKINLVHYFLHVEKYKALSMSSENVTYLSHKTAENQLIVISLVEFDEELITKISSDMKNAKHDKVNVLKIALSKDVARDENTIVIGEPIFYKDELKEKFPKISKLELRNTNNNDSDEAIPEEEMMEMLQHPEKAQNKELRELTAKIKQGFIPVTWLLTTLFCLLPIVSFALSYWYSAKGSSYMSNGSVVSLFFGASDRNLTILGGQWWRLFTYGFNCGPATTQVFGLIESIVIGMLVYSTSKYVEAAVGPLKLISSVVVAYILAGFVSTAIPSAIVGGPYAILAALVGVLGFSTAKKNSPISIISKGKLILPLIVLVIVPFFDGNMINYLMLIVAVGFSGSIMFFWNYNYKAVSFDLIAPSIILGVGLILPIVLIFAYSPVPAYSGEDIYTIQSYLEQNWIKDLAKGSNILHKVGWGSLGFKLEPDADGNEYIQLITTGDARGDGSFAAFNQLLAWGKNWITK